MPSNGMNLSTWASAGQLALSAATAAVAFAVYRVQADKLFLEMRDNRIAVIDRYRDAMSGRLAHISGITRANLDTELSAEQIQERMSKQWSAELGVKRWFGAELELLMKTTDLAFLEATQEKIRWCQAERRQGANYQLVMEQHHAALKALERVLEAANPHIQAGRRGLPLSKSWHLWRSRTRLRRGPGANGR
jgi:hypothetical protein